MKKESRFCKKGIKILLAIGLLGTMIVPTNAMANEYVTPGDAKKANSESVDVTIIFNELDENGARIPTTPKMEMNVKVGTTFKEAGIQFPTRTYKDLTHLGWVDSYGHAVDENTILDGNQTYYDLYPDFDKVVTSVTFKYPDTNGDIKGLTVPEVKETYILEHGATYQDLVNQIEKYLPEDMSKEAKFNGWSIGADMDRKLISGEKIGAVAKFENKTVLLVDYYYYNKQGMQVLSSKAEFVSKNASTKEILEEIPLPTETFEGSRISGWEDDIHVKSYTNGEAIIKDYIPIQVFPKYENYVIGFAIDDLFRRGYDHTRGDYSKVEAYYAIVAEKGDVVKVPEIKGYSNITWIDGNPNDRNIIVKTHMNFCGYEDKTEVPDVNPDNGDNNNGNKNETEIPDVTLPEESINVAVNEVKNATKGDKVTVDMKGNVTLPVEVLESAKGKDVEVVFNMGTYSWSINGLDITADTLKAINLEVKLNANAISADIVKALAKDRPTMQLSLSHNGEFGFKAKLQFNIGAEHKGKYGNLYYYNEKGKLEFMNAGKIDEAGNVSLEFTHASDYVVVIDEKSMAEETKKTESPIKDTSSDTNGSVTAVMVLIALLGGAYYLHNKKAKVSLK